MLLTARHIYHVMHITFTDIVICLIVYTGLKKVGETRRWMCK